MKLKFFTLIMATLLSNISFAEDSVLCEDKGTLDITLTSDDSRNHTVNVYSYRKDTEYELKSILGKLVGKRYYQLIQPNQELSLPIQNLRLEFDNGTTIREIITIQDLDRKADGDEFEALVYQMDRGSPQRLVRKLACYLTQS